MLDEHENHLYETASCNSRRPNHHDRAARGVLARMKKSARFTVLALVLAACGGSDAASIPSGSSGDGGAGAVSLDARRAAVAETISKNPYCSPLRDFYWEIGDGSGALASGSVGATRADTKMPIASASKLVFGAYVVERFKDDLGKIDAAAMRMLSGYTSLDYTSCLGTTTVSKCFQAKDNSKYDPNELNRFFYNGGHFQKYAVDLGLGDDDGKALADHIAGQVGADWSFTYGSPQLAAGIQTSASDYAIFLRKILGGKLAIHDHLGDQSVCTQKSTCPAADYSPATAAWHYSYAHWVEDDPQTGDGAFSSPGAFGFYPWIDATKTYYGVVARYAPLAPQAYLESAQCGAAIRKAFITGKGQ